LRDSSPTARTSVIQTVPSASALDHARSRGRRRRFHAPIVIGDDDRLAFHGAERRVGDDGRAGDSGGDADSQSMIPGAVHAADAQLDER
jgi:hypothetical protein